MNHQIILAPRPYLYIVPSFHYAQFEQSCWEAYQAETLFNITWGKENDAPSLEQIGENEFALTRVYEDTIAHYIFGYTTSEQVSSEVEIADLGIACGECFHMFLDDVGRWLNFQHLFYNSRGLHKNIPVGEVW